jgi:hypothetical protein
MPKLRNGRAPGHAGANAFDCLVHLGIGYVRRTAACSSHEMHQ